MVLTGGCFCGRVRYETDDPPFNATICHCVDCRRVAAAPMVAWLSVRRSALRFIGNAPKTFASSAKAERSFCPDCGTPLTFQATDRPDDVDVATASLDDPAMVPPADHTWTHRRLSWVMLADGLPQYGESRPE